MGRRTRQGARAADHPRTRKPGRAGPGARQFDGQPDSPLSKSQGWGVTTGKRFSQIPRKEPMNRKANKTGNQGMNMNTCCEGQGTRLLGAMPEFIYSLAADGLYVNLFAASSIAWQQAGQSLKLHMVTGFPFRPEVELRFSAARPVRARLRIRVPAWAARDMPIRVNGSAAATGKAGTYVTLDRVWKEGDTVSFTLPMDFRLTHYAGVERVAGQEQYALEYGPIDRKSVV